MQELPSFASIRFSCPHCGALAHQHWGRTEVCWLGKDKVPSRFDAEKLQEIISQQKGLPSEKRFSDYEVLPEYLRLSEGAVFVSDHRKDDYTYQLYSLDVSRCDSCDEICIWLKDKLIFPATGPSVMPNPDMPNSVEQLYSEAAAVFSASPKSSAAMLRLALQVLLKELGEEGKNINTDIERLIEKGLSPNLSKVMHSLRIIGNESVHPGVISVDDDPEMSKAMFRLLNEIVEQLITRPREQQELWEMLPASKRAPVEAKLKKGNRDPS